MSEQESKKPRASLESWISGYRWNGLEKAVRDGALKFGLRIDYINEQHGLIKSTVYFKVSGSFETVKAFKQATAASVKSFNES